jgi:glycogenin
LWLSRRRIRSTVSKLLEPDLLAYVTLLSTESYVPGVLALHEALRRTRTPHPLVTAISAHLPAEIDRTLEQAGILVRRIPESKAIPKAMIEGNGHWGHTFDKVHLFSLTEFEKLVYVDSDMIVLANMDELFDKPHMSAVRAGQLVHPTWNRLNGGLLVVEPAEGLADGIFATLPQAIKDAAALGQTNLGDQDLLNAYYPNWQDMPELSLHHGYNMLQCYLDVHIKEHGYRLPHHPEAGPGGSGTPIKIVHFIGPRKPWMKGATIRQYKRALQCGSAGKWENKLFFEYQKLIKDSQPKKQAA